MLLTILGRHAPYAPQGGAGPGYLVQSGGVSILLDGGPGTLARLHAQIDPRDLTAVLVSHLHPDHFSDLHSLQYLLEDLGDVRRPVPIYAPDVPNPDRHWLEPVLREYQQLLPLPVAEGLTLGPLHVTFCRTDHSEPCWAMRITDGTATLVYSADTGTGVDLAPFAQGADLLLVESTYVSTSVQRHPGHLTAAAAADLGRRAGVRRVLLTHLLPSTVVSQAEAEARAVHPGAEAAVEMRTYVI